MCFDSPATTKERDTSMSIWRESKKRLLTPSRSIQASLVASRLVSFWGTWLEGLRPHHSKESDRQHELQNITIGGGRNTVSSGTNKCRQTYENKLVVGTTLYPNLPSRLRTWALSESFLPSPLRQNLGPYFLPAALQHPFQSFFFV